MDNLSQYSNESQYRRPPKLILNEVRISGTDGVFQKTLLREKKELNEQYGVEDLGKEIKVVFLKIRRKLVEYTKKDGFVRSTTEHNHRGDVVTLFHKAGGRDVAPAEQLRQTYPGLRTIQVVYAMLMDGVGGEVVRLNVKGASLGSQNKREGVMSFYDYLTSFTDNEHTYEYVTVLKAESEKSALGQYYCINFVRDNKLSPEQMEKIGQEMKRIHVYTTALDAFYQGDKNEDKGKEESIPTIQVESSEDEIRADDIPF